MAASRLLRVPFGSFAECFTGRGLRDQDTWDGVAVQVSQAAGETAR